MNFMHNSGITFVFATRFLSPKSQVMGKLFSLYAHTLYIDYVDNSRITFLAATL